MHFLLSSLAVILLTFAALVAQLLALQWTRMRNVPKDLPWVGLQDKRLFPRIRAGLREITAGRGPLNEGYQKYGRNGKAFILPTHLWPDVVLPASNLAWLAAQPEGILSANKVHDGLLAPTYLVHGPDLDAVVDFTVLRRDLTRNLSKLLPDVVDEVEVCLQETIGDGLEDWKEIKIFDVITKVSRRLNNRVFVGLPVARDQPYLKGLKTWELALAISSAVIRYLVPFRLRPWLAPMIAIPSKCIMWRLRRLLQPLIDRRIRAARFPEVKATREWSNDVLQWLLNETSKREPDDQMSVGDIAGKTIMLNFFSVHTIAFNCSSILTDILCYPSADFLITELRDEAEAMIPRMKDDPKTVREMVKMDSVIRESLRLNTMSSRALAREVVAPDGIVTPDGLYLPLGSHVSANVCSMQRDLDVWHQSDEFVPLRFVDSASADMRKGAVHVTEDFLSFGFGRRACPGRFFAVQALKVLLGNLLIRYDFQPLTERPATIEIGEMIMLSDKATVKLRKRHPVDV